MCELKSVYGDLNLIQISKCFKADFLGCVFDGKKVFDAKRINNSTGRYTAINTDLDILDKYIDELDEKINYSEEYDDL
jgi:hypothetical protein